jgi:hypothetical protein
MEATGRAATESTDSVGLLLPLIWCLAFWMVLAATLLQLT